MPVLSTRALGRATLARQLLLDRAELPVAAAVERLLTRPELGRQLAARWPQVTIADQLGVRVIEGPAGLP
jgi:hypothetical protein